MKEKNEGPPCCGRPAEPRRWQPAYHERYFLILGNGRIQGFRWSDTEFDHDAWRFGNCFRDRKDAERARKFIKQLLQNLHAEYGR